MFIFVSRSIVCLVQSQQTTSNNKGKQHDKIITHSRYRKLLRRGIEVWSFDMDEGRLHTRIPLGYLDGQPSWMPCIWNLVCIFQQALYPIPFLVPAAYHRLLWRFHHLLYLCQREHANASERQCRKLYRICNHQPHRRNCIDRIRILVSQIKVSRICIRNSSSTKTEY